VSQLPPIQRPICGYGGCAGTRVPIGCAVGNGNKVLTYRCDFCGEQTTESKPDDRGIEGAP